MDPTQTVDDAVRALPADVDLLAGVLPLATIVPFADLLFGGALLVGEIVFWTAALVYSKLVVDWRSAAFFVANTYTTVGYGTFVLQPAWNMLAPIIAISGLFTFGWTGSVLVGYVNMLNRARHGPDPVP